MLYYCHNFLGKKSMKRIFSRPVVIYNSMVDPRALTLGISQVAIRLDRDVLTAFRESGAGWQTRMNAALRDWLKTHSPTLE
jgi:uncharacterized protein (DUF4415 family)